MEIIFKLRKNIPKPFKLINFKKSKNNLKLKSYFTTTDAPILSTKTNPFLESTKIIQNETDRIQTSQMLDSTSPFDNFNKQNMNQCCIFLKESNLIGLKLEILLIVMLILMIFLMLFCLFWFLFCFKKYFFFSKTLKLESGIF